MGEKTNKKQITRITHLYIAGEEFKKWDLLFIRSKTVNSAKIPIEEIN
jgi:hypothetical protein